MEAVELIAERVRECERLGVSLLCCPEAILGGLADYCEDPLSFAFASWHDLEGVLSPIASETVTCIVGYTERAGVNLYNAAAVMRRGRVMDVYRKHHPALRHSRYSPGTTLPVFDVQDATVGILICNDSNFSELSSQLIAKGASVLCIPTNNGLPLEKNHRDVAAAARAVDKRLATAHGVHVVRADVSGKNAHLASHGSSAITNKRGNVVCESAGSPYQLLVSDIDVLEKSC